MSGVPNRHHLIIDYFLSITCSAGQTKPGLVTFLHSARKRIGPFCDATIASRTHNVGLTMKSAVAMRCV